MSSLVAKNNKRIIKLVLMIMMTVVMITMIAKMNYSLLPWGFTYVFLNKS